MFIASVRTVHHVRLTHVINCTYIYHGLLFDFGPAPNRSRTGHVSCQIAPEKMGSTLVLVLHNFRFGLRRQMCSGAAVQGEPMWQEEPIQR